MILGTMRSFFILLFCLVEWSNSQACPDRYKRFSKEHSFCLLPNPTCQIIRTGVSENDKELILKFHNQFRSKVAMGNEDRSIGGPLPQAADMMQMEWDDELAAVAQKWTEHCHWGHDCKECKAVENFSVGQNLARSFFGPNTEPDWSVRLTRLYDEVINYHRNWFQSHQSRSGPPTGHFTQLIWSRSWRVGCGYTLFKQDGGFTHYYACNYGPVGNVLQQPVYKQGQPCSACPTNTQCSTSSRGANTFPGLCKMDNPNTSPVYAINPNGLLFYCAPLNSGSQCRAEVYGDGRWETVRSIGGNYMSLVLKGGQSSTLTYSKPIVPNGDSFCLRIYYRKGPLDASNKDKSSLIANFKAESGFSSLSDLTPYTTRFDEFSLNVGWGMKTTLSLTFSVPRGAGQYVVDLRKIIAFDGNCESRSD